jgi:hypothetical protein
MATQAIMALRMGQSFSVKRSDSTNQVFKNTELPPEKDWEADHSLSMLMLDGLVAKLIRIEI